MPSKTSSATSRRIPLSVPYLAGHEWDYVKECIDTAWVSSVGSYVQRFERDIASYTKASHAIATVNGTAALHVALQLIGLQPGEMVLVSNLTFVAPINAIRYLGGIPAFMDADPQTWQMDTAKLERFLRTQCEMRVEGTFYKPTGQRVRAILPVHILGFACDMDHILRLAKEFRLSVVEDAAEALGVTYKNQHLGTLGDVGILSFNGNKIMTSGGGGMILTADAKKASYAHYLTTQAKDDVLEYIHREIGYNYRLNNINAALGVAQLEQLPQFIAKKRALAETYRSAFQSENRLTLMPLLPNVQATYWLYTVLLPEETTIERRKQFIQRLLEKGVESRPLWHPINTLVPYREHPAYEITHSLRLYDRAVSLPSSVGLTPDDQAYCIEQVLNTLKEWT